MSLAQMLTDVMKEHGAKRVVSLKVRVGKLSGVVVESFVFAFDMIKESFPGLEEAQLNIEEVPITYRCSSCGLVFEKDEPFFVECPSCKGIDVKLLSGEEFDLCDVELEV